MSPEQERALRMCKHKVKYALLSTAQKKAEQSSKSSGETIEPYKCDICGSYHLGHPKEYSADAKPIQELHLAKIRDPFGNHYIFAVDTEEDLNGSTQEIYKEGVLVAYKKGKDPFKERGGFRSKHWKIFQALYPRMIQSTEFEFMEILEAKKESMGAIGDSLESPEAPEENLVVPVASTSAVSEEPADKPEEVSKLSLEEILKKFKEMSAPDSGLSGDYVKGFIYGVLLDRLKGAQNEQRSRNHWNQNGPCD